MELFFEEVQDTESFINKNLTAIPIITGGQFQAFQRFSSGKLVLKAVESCFVALNYYGNGSIMLLLSLCMWNLYILIPSVRTWNLLPIS